MTVFGCTCTCLIMVGVPVEPDVATVMVLMWADIPAADDVVSTVLDEVRALVVMVMTFPPAS